MMHHLIRSIIATAFCVATCCLAPHTLPADESQQPRIQGVPTKTLPIDGQVFEIEGRTAFLIPPESVRPGQAVPWIWYAPTLPNLPSNAEEWMFRRFTRNGIAIAGIDVGESYGSPAGSRLYTLLYEHLVSKGFSSRPILLGRSRGGLMTLSWAADHPDRVGAFAGIYPVCNLASYPGLDRACGAFQLSAQELSQRLKEFNPIDRLGPLAKAGVPMFSIHGDVDTVVPLEKNSGMMRDRYVALGGQMQLIVPKGQGHNMWKGFFECEELMAFIGTHAFEFGELIFEDTFERDEPQELKDEPGNGWTTSSDTTAGGHKQVDLREGSMFIETHKTANHAASVRHPFEFQNGVIELRLMLPSDTDSLNINIADPEFKDVHAGHLFSVKVSTTHITIEDLATGVMKTSIRTARQNGQLTNEQQSMLSKLKLSTAHAIAKNEWHHIVIQIHKDQAKVLIDGRQIAEFQSPGIAHPNKRVLRLLPPEAAVVDDIRIWRSVATSHRPAAVSHRTAQMKLSQPLDYQVVQRTPDNAGRVRVSGTLEDAPSREQTVSFEARYVRANETTDQTSVKWLRVSDLMEGNRFSGELTVPSGGWYQIQVRSLCGGEVVATTQIDHVGVGEIFIVAGQSNSANHGEGRQSPETGRVAAFDGNRWQIAHDPQPGASGNGGSFLPAFGDAVVRQFHVPVGFVACGIGATSVREWLPRGETFRNPPTIESRVVRLDNGDWASNGQAFQTLIHRMKPLGIQGFRAVLWHQGESDANQKDQSRTLPGTEYATYLRRLIEASRQETGWQVPWFVAQATYHVPGDESSPEIRQAQASLWRDGVAFQGPDTDTLVGRMREANGQGVHFSEEGLKAHGQLWAELVIPWLHRETAASTEKSTTTE